MHVILFGLKRAYWGSIAKSRWPLCEHRAHLTAARFDLMRVVRTYSVWKMMRQSRLPGALGVCQPVITRMIKSLVALGWMTRERSKIDRRTYDVGLTEEGEKVIDSAYHRFVRSVRARRWVHQALLGMNKWPDRDAAFEAVEALDSWLNRLRRTWSKRATLYYRWHPDD
jgi:DNA-binding MarR family transcriptional regulator